MSRLNVFRVAIHGLVLGLLAALANPATAAAQDVQIEVVQTGHAVAEPGYIIQQVEPLPVDIAPIQADEPEELTDRPAWAAWHVWVDAVDLGELDLVFDEPEVAALAGLRLPQASALDQGLAGGVSWGTGARPTKWLRLPEVRVSFGGGSVDSGWIHPDGAPDDLEVRPTSALTFRVEVAGGFAAQIGRLTPFVIGRVGYAGWWIDTEVQHGALGALGTETIADGVWVLGVDIGAGYRISDEVEIFGAWRRTFAGAAGHGGMIGVSLGYGSD